MLKRIVLFIAVIILSAWPAKGAHQPKLNQEEKRLLEERVKQHLTLTNVDLRQKVDDLFLLASVYDDEENAAEALRLYEKALQVDPWRLEYQVRMAKLLKQKGDKGSAIEKTALVYKYAEDEELIKDAAAALRELGEVPMANQPYEKADVNEALEIVIVPIGKFGKVFMEELTHALESTMGIKYTIDKKLLDTGEFDRNAADRYLSAAVEHLKEHVPRETIDAELAELGMKPVDLETSEGMARLMEKAFKDAGAKEKDIEEFRQRIKEMREQGQYNADRLRAELTERRPIDKKSHVKGYLGITEGDIYRKDHNFLFGFGGRGHAVMSYHRFLASFNEEPPDRSRLLKRSLKQGISSSFFILGIERCTMPTCARAYPHSLTEHDQKQVVLCADCRRKLNDVIAKAKSARASED